MCTWLPTATSSPVCQYIQHNCHNHGPRQQFSGLSNAKLWLNYPGIEKEVLQQFRDSGQTTHTVIRGGSANETLMKIKR